MLIPLVTQHCNIKATITIILLSIIMINSIIVINSLVMLVLFWTSAFSPFPAIVASFNWESFLAHLRISYKEEIGQFGALYVGLFTQSNATVSQQPLWVVTIVSIQLTSFFEIEDSKAVTYDKLEFFLCKYMCG